MSSNRIYDLARQLNVPSRDLLDVLKNQGIDVKSHMSTVDDATANIILEKFQKKPKGESQKNEGKSFQEKKIGTRTYIPPRKRQRGSRNVRECLKGFNTRRTTAKRRRH